MSIQMLWENSSRALVSTCGRLRIGSFGAFGYDGGYIFYGLDLAADATVTTPADGTAPTAEVSTMEVDTHELYLSLSYDFVVSPFVTVYYDIDEGEGGFLVLGAGYSLPVTEAISVDFGADVTVNLDNELMGAGEDGEAFTGLYNCDLSVGTSIPFLDVLSLDLSLAYSFPLSTDAEMAIASLSVDGEDSVLFGGAALSLAF